MSTMITAKAPGSLMVLGEHAVLHGEPAIVTAVPAYITVSFTQRADDVFSIQSSLGEYSTPKSALTIAEPFAFIRAALLHYKDALSHGLDIEVVSDISSTKGYGSSAAVTVATTHALHKLLKLPTDPLSLFLAADAIVQKTQGMGSGADVAASAFNACLYYQRTPLLIDIIAPCLPLHTAYSGFKTPTVEVIKHVNRLAHKSPTQYSALYKKIGALVRQGKTAILSRSETQLATYLKENQALMLSLGVNHDALDEQINLAYQDENTLAAKISGSGLGDSIIILKKNMLSALDTIKRETIAFAPTNIALVKYWGKRCAQYNLPNTDSLSITIPQRGTFTHITAADAGDVFYLNNILQNKNSQFSKRLSQFLDLVSPQPRPCVEIRTHNTIPTAAGLASSASGFAALTLALDAFLNWQYTKQTLSTLARQGSGSAARSFWNGFVYWQAGTQPSGSDSFAYPLTHTWPDLCVGLLMVEVKEKSISSRDAMKCTVDTSTLYQSRWEKQVSQDLASLQESIKEKDFTRFGTTLENNALLMHATMEDSKPPISFSTPLTQDYQRQIWALRTKGIDVYFTQDAGPNLKLIFLAKDKNQLAGNFSELIVLPVF